MNQNSNSLGIFTEPISIVSCPNCDAELDVSEFRVFEEIVCPSCQEKFQVPGRLGDFILIEELGRGAMGCVYLAMDESLKRLVALKVIRKEYGEDPKMLETVQREAQAMATLNHRNIVQVYSFGRFQEQPYFVMELLEGERLEVMMGDGKQVSEIRALEIALDVAHGLDAANQAGLTHGDIKPANILMNDHRVAKVVDFGLAKFMEPGAEIEVWGTPYYIAPEKARKKGEDSRSDQYSLGGTLFHALAGQPPFDGSTPTKVVVAALKEDTPDLRDFNPNVTEKTAAVVRRMMDKNPNRRYPTYASLLSDLNLAMEEAKKAEEERMKAEKLLHAKQHKKKNPLLLIVAIITMIVFAGLGIFVWSEMKTPSAPLVPQYDGPAREEHLPFSRSEVRNFTEAVAAVQDKNLGLAEQKLEVAARFIPDNHVAYAWYKFLEAGIYFYAQYPDKARTLLEEVVSEKEMIFDSDKTPDEDPRILAEYALGEVNDRALSKAVRRSQPYYAHLAELAKGYRILLEGDANSSARYFRAYSEHRTQGINWPYVLQPLAPLLHLPLEKLISEPAVKEDSNEQAKRLLSGIGIRSQEGYPLFKTTSVGSDGSAQLKKATNTEWVVKDGQPRAKIPQNQILVSATGVQILPNRSFTISARIRSKDPKNKNPPDTAVLFQFGAFQPVTSDPPSDTVPVKGLVVEFAPGNPPKPSLRIRLGDGEKDLVEQTLVSESIRMGSSQVYSVVWDGYRKDGSTPSNQLTFYVDGTEIGSVDLSNFSFKPMPDAIVVTVGRGIGRGNTIGWSGKDLSVDQIYVFPEALSKRALQKWILELF